VNRNCFARLNRRCPWAISRRRMAMDQCDERLLIPSFPRRLGAALDEAWPIQPLVPSHVPATSRHDRQLSIGDSGLVFRVLRWKRSCAFEYRRSYEPGYISSVTSCSLGLHHEPPTEMTVHALNRASCRSFSAAFRERTVCSDVSIFQSGRRRRDNPPAERLTARMMRTRVWSGGRKE